MSNDDDRQNKAATVYQSLEEVNALISELEMQVKSGLIFIQSEIEPVEIVAPEERSFILQSGTLFTDWI